MVQLPRKKAFDTVAKVATAKIAEAPAAPATETSAATDTPKKSRSMVKRGVLAAVLLAGAAFGGEYGYHYWTVGRFIESTDDAYVKADYTTIAPKVSGYIKEVLVNDNDTVKAGQVLARIDDR